MRPFSTHLGRWLGVAALAAVLSTPALAQRNVTLRMNSATMPDTIKADATASGAQLRGGLVSGTTALPDGNTIDWGSATTVIPTNVGGDYWEVNFQIPDNDELRFKFYFQQSEDAGIGGWEDNGPTDGNFAIPAGTDDVSLDLHYFNKTGSQQNYDWRPFTVPGDSIGVWFRVYMNTVKAGEKNYTPDDGNLVVALRGNFGTRGAVGSEGAMTDWGGTEGRLMRESTDPTKPGYHLFSGLVKFPASQAGEDVGYKFYFNDSDVSGDAGYEDGGDRHFNLPAAGADTTLHWSFYSSSPALQGTLVTANVAFQVDISPLSTVGLFQTAEDSVQVRGGFNGWDCPDSNRDDCLLQQDPGTAQFLREIPIKSLPGSEQTFKYYVSLNNADGSPFFTNSDGSENFDAGYEEPLDYGGGNRTFEFSGTDQVIDLGYFDSIRPDNVIAANQSVDLTFRVDMNPAKAFTGAQGAAFNVATDTVTVQFEDSFWLATQGLKVGSSDLLTGSGGSLIPGFKLTDPDNDGVYTGTLTVQGPTYNGIAYRYAFGNENDGLRVEGQGGFDAGRRRYRYIMDRAASTYAFALDTFKPSNAPVPWEINPTGSFAPGDIQYSVANGAADGTGPTGVEGSVERGALAIGRVHPNPTAGAARVEVSAPADAFVTVRVFDVTGRVVATVAENALVAGRTLDFETTGMAAGLYLVRAEAGGQVASTSFTVVR